MKSEWTRTPAEVEGVCSPNQNGYEEKAQRELSVLGTLTERLTYPPSFTDYRFIFQQHSCFHQTFLTAHRQPCPDIFSNCKRVEVWASSNSFVLNVH